jgi:chemotaxis protein CheZ
VAGRRAPPHAINTNQNLIGLVNRSAVSIHHIGDRAWICPVAFILHERGALMVNRWYAARANRRHDAFGVNLTLNRIGLKHT